MNYFNRLRAKVMDDITTKNDRAYMSSLEASSEEISVMKEQGYNNHYLSIVMY